MLRRAWARHFERSEAGSDGMAVPANGPTAACSCGRCRGAAWLDLMLPTDAERSWTEQCTSLRVPAHADLAEIESSSRLAVSGQVLTLSTPMTYLGPDGTSMVAPLGFVLSLDHRITVRFAEVPVFDLFAGRLQAAEHSCSTAAFVGLLEAMVDRLAGVLEHAGADLDGMSRRVFGAKAEAGRNASEIDQKLRATLSASTSNTEAACLPSARPMSLSDWPSFHRVQSSRFCSAWAWC